MKISGRTQMLSRLPVSKVLELYKRLGFESIEFGLLDINFHIRPDLIEDYIIAHNVERAQSLGLSISAVSNHLGYTQDDDVFEFHLNSIPKIKQFGTDVLIIAAGGISPIDRQYNLELKNEFKRRTGVLCRAAEQNGVRLAIEPEPGQWVATLDDFYELKESTGCNTLNMNMDIGHAFLMENSVEQAIIRAGKDIIHCHVENMRRGEHLHLLPQEGEIDLLAAFKALKCVGFDGGMSLDLYVLPYEETAEEAIHYCNGLLTQL